MNLAIWVYKISLKFEINVINVGVCRCLSRSISTRILFIIGLTGGTVTISTFLYFFLLIKNTSDYDRLTLYAKTFLALTATIMVSKETRDVSKPILVPAKSSQCQPSQFHQQWWNRDFRIKTFLNFFLSYSSLCVWHGSAFIFGKRWLL